MGRGTRMRSLHFQTVELRTRMIRETEEYLTIRLPGQDVRWPPNRCGRRSGIGQRTRPWELGRFQASTRWPSAERSCS